MTPLTEKDLVLPLLAAALTAALLLVGCEAEPVGGPVPVTEILRVEVDPNPVAAGDTAVFTCIIRDSMDPNLEYEWQLIGDPLPFPTTDTNRYQWEAPSDTGQHRHQVRVDAPDSAGVAPVQKPFEVTVAEN